MSRISFPTHAGIQSIYEMHVDRDPNRIAVVCEDDQRTYGDLNRRANRLARHLRSIGVGPEVLVGICLERSVQMAEAILATLKAGGGYVPLDPSYPKDRLRFMSRNADVRVLLTDGDTAGDLVQGVPQLVRLDTDAAAIMRHGDSDLEPTAADDDVAYVIYTSGSTGEPRGVVVTHSNLCHYVGAIHVPMALTSRDVYLHTASFSFSSSVRQLLVPLSHGAEVVIATRDQIRDPLALFSLIQRRGVTVIDLVPSYWRSSIDALEALDEAGRAALLNNHLRLILSASEPLLSDLPRRWAQELKHGARLLNMFGQTETTGLVSCYPIPPDGSDDVKVVPIGRPIANTQVHVLDQQLKPVPVGVDGEIFIGGAGVARGYLSRRELTAKRFIPDPFGENRGARLYRTGDLGRWRADGNLEFLGRMDHQVKIRGSRVELGEIEGALSQHPGVRQSVVIARHDTPAENTLIAYFVPLGPPPTATELRRFLGQRLPDYMVPSAFVSLTTLPLTPTGKVDRRALPRIQQTRLETDEVFDRPRDLLEYQLKGIWEELLHVSPIGRKDDFFELGGHSLLAVRMMDRIAEVWGTKLPVATLFNGATIECLSAALRQQHGLDFSSMLVEIQSGGSKPPFFFLSGDYTTGGLYCKNLARHLGADRPFYALRPHGLDGETVPETVEAMATAYLNVLRAFKPRGPYMLGGYCNGGIVAFELARQLHAQGETVDALVLIEAAARSVRFKLLHDAIRLSGRLLQFESGRVVGWHELLKYYDTRLRDFFNLPLVGRVSFLTNKAIRTVKRLFRPDATQPHMLRRWRLEYTDQVAAVADAHHKALVSYVPRRYPGPVALLYARAGSGHPGDDPSFGWHRVAGQVSLEYIPGDHVTSITSHVDAIARHIRDVLEKVDASQIQPQIDEPARATA